MNVDFRQDNIPIYTSLKSNTKKLLVSNAEMANLQLFKISANADEPRFPKMHSERLIEHENPDIMTIAVDATPSRVGGLLRLPGNERKIYFYSVDWTSLFKFGDDSAAFETVNAALALEIFAPIIHAYRPRYKKLIFKTDSCFLTRRKALKRNEKYALLGAVINQIKDYDGEVKHATTAERDPDIINVDYFSRSEMFLGLKAPYLIPSGNDDHQLQYTFVNLSERCKQFALNTVRQRVPETFVERAV